jgi:hypothetical protein
MHLTAVELRIVGNLPTQEELARFVASVRLVAGRHAFSASKRLLTFNVSTTLCKRDYDSKIGVALLTQNAVAVGAHHSNIIHSKFISYFENVRQITLRFYAPIGGLAPPYHACKIGAYLQGFDVELILKLRKLEKITLVGESSVYTCIWGVSRDPRDNIYLRLGNDVGKLLPLVDVGHQIKKGFEEKNQGIDVQVHLRYAEQFDKIIC